MPGPSLWHELAVLFKLRVVVLLLFAAVGGAFLAAGGLPSPGRLAVLLVCGGLASAGASALNEYLERGLDARMVRTQQRPLVTGSIARQAWVPWAGALMIALPVLAVLPFNPYLSLFLVLGAAVYLGIYTAWLKSRSLLNIVVGGLAGSASVLSGSAAAGNWSDPGALWLALLVFLWTPTHFWSLAIAHRDDYARGGFPMLPVQVGPRAASWWVLPHTLGTAGAALALATRPALGLPYLAPVTLAGAYMLVRNVLLIRRPSRTQALRLFGASNLFLAVALLAICTDVLIR